MIINTKKDEELSMKGINPVYFITCMEKDGTEKNKLGYADFGSMRTFGFFYDLKKTREALEENAGDMHEYLYSFAIIEKMYPGIHPMCIEEEEKEWYRYDFETDGFIINPEMMTNEVCNFALG